jgi:ATP-dependent Lon protease
MLDEVDKLGRDFRGDPASALMEILDPEQNKEFHDNYLDLPFDLSRVFFITTANTLDQIPRPLLDRMEVLRLAGYTNLEKREIAKRYLIPRQIREAGLTAQLLLIPDESLSQIIERYTREAGVRELERMIGRVARKVTTRFAEGHTEPVTVNSSDLVELLGAERFMPEQARRELRPGVAAGLAWTETGGDVLYVEAVLVPDEKQLVLTGHLGEVMRESAKAARSYLLSQGKSLQLRTEQVRDAGMHVHVPAGAIPKDGPSAGVTMATAMASLLAGAPARSDTAMTGEITLSGLVLPVGGIKEKLIAAHRAGLRRIILPRDNEKQLDDLPEQVRTELEFVFVDTIEDVLEAAIVQCKDDPGRNKPEPVAVAER